MPRRELRYPSQIERWLAGWGGKLNKPAQIILIGSGGLLRHAAQREIDTPQPENSMDVDPITMDDEVALFGYEPISARLSGKKTNGPSISCRMDACLGPMLDSGMPGLLYVWEHPEHPHRERFKENRALIEGLLECKDPRSYAESVACEKWSLRTLRRGKFHV
ncbi:MAG TPA: hypothetical protein VL981_02890 [Candidatus Methylacidiphilales bacterium]|nr:hypothetical protein [Candidatus Methylacidiphilales bacterium]